MAEENKIQNEKKGFSPDWFVRGILTRLGETFDRFTGRSWKPSSSLATSQLIEKLKILLDAEAKDYGEKAQFVPHHIELKMQWDKFSTDAEQSLKKLEIELLTAAIDHINDRRYHTFAPIRFEIKPDYFTEGVKLSASFDEFADENETENAINVSIPDLKNVVIASPEKEITEPEMEVFIASFTAGNLAKQVKLAFSPTERKSVGRTKENDLWLDDASVSKLHAALVLDAENQLMVADTGSTNGTFVNGVRIAYGKAHRLKDSDNLSFGTLDVELRHAAGEASGEKLAAQNFPADAMAADTNFPIEENTRMKNRYSTRVDFPVGENEPDSNDKTSIEIAEDKT